MKDEPLSRTPRTFLLSPSLVVAATAAAAVPLSLSGCGGGGVGGDGVWTETGGAEPPETSRHLCSRTSPPSLLPEDSIQ